MANPAPPPPPPPSSPDCVVPLIATVVLGLLACLAWAASGGLPHAARFWPGP